MIVALIGADGVGKTTVASLLATHLIQKGFSAYVEGSFEEYFLLKVLFLFMPFETRVRVSQTVFANRNFISKVLTTTWPYLVLIDQYILYLYLRLFTSRKIVLADRYPYGFLMSWRYYGISNKVLRWLYLHFPRPDMCFVLRAPPDVIFKRKGVESEGYPVN